ncbi:MAG TPA: phosphomannomutase/phosphoglucomutase [Alphaproteobacteria bacterium]|nr:phosphomannomutase/phosphoglucomutase [Alphaproteobacteria bacterium]HAJ47546.1 phosphomannomutase/phosphoglucomutase [Alphaproteobacteria bacterium]
MFALPVATLAPNTPDFEMTPLVKPTGFREYDARWLFPSEINLMGVQALGLGLGTLIHELGVRPDLVTGHDYRSYSLSIKQALTAGLMAAGVRVHDIGLALSPTAYFAQFELDCPCVAMVTASHNENGWTGVKMGVARPLTFGPDEINQLKDIVMTGRGQARAGGTYRFVPGMQGRYIRGLDGRKLSRPIKAVVACGNGTAGIFAPAALRQIGVDVVELDCTPDYTFPRYNPNPEDMKMLHALADAVKARRADIGLAFDGDGDRCGIVDETGTEIFADKAGVLIARAFSTLHPGATFVADVKSTGLFATDPVLKKNGVKTDYWKTGHSYIKRRSFEIGAMAGFEKSGHFFFNAPFGKGYDDGIASAIAMLYTLDGANGMTMSALYASLPKTWSTPTMAPKCADEVKYDVVDRVTAQYQAAEREGQRIAGQSIASLVTVNGIRVTLADGTWGLVRASSNKPSLVVVCESPASDAQMRAMFADIDARLGAIPEVGAYDQKI